jgi:hypothetical protein
MAGKSPVTATDGQKAALKALGHCADLAEADRARALLVRLDGWTSGQIAQAFGVRPDVPLCQGSCPLLYFSLIFRWAD